MMTLRDEVVFLSEAEYEYSSERVINSSPRLSQVCVWAGEAVWGRFSICSLIQVIEIFDASYRCRQFASAVFGYYT